MSFFRIDLDALVERVEVVAPCADQGASLARAASSMTSHTHAASLR